MGGGKNILSLTQDLESPDLHNALLGHSFIVKGWAIHHQCQKPCFWAYTMVTQVGSLMRFGEGCLNHILSGLQHPTFSYKDSLSPWDLELCFSPTRQLVVPHNNFVFFLTKTEGIVPSSHHIFALRTAVDADLPWIQHSPGVSQAYGWFPSLLEQIWHSFSRSVKKPSGLACYLFSQHGAVVLLQKLCGFVAFFSIFLGKTFFLRLIKL